MPVSQWEILKAAKIQPTGDVAECNEHDCGYGVYSTLKTGASLTALMSPAASTAETNLAQRITLIYSERRLVSMRSEATPSPVRKETPYCEDITVTKDLDLPLGKSIVVPMIQGGNYFRTVLLEKL